MSVDQLPTQVREFANYLDGLLARLDESGGWCGVFWQRDPEGMQACLDGRELPPWDVLEALLQDYAAEYGPGAAAEETARARALHTAALTAHDLRPGGWEALRDRLDVMLREQRYAAERLTTLTAALAAATSAAEAEALRVDLAWARDDHVRAGARCVELRRRMGDLDRATGHEGRLVWGGDRVPPQAGAAGRAPRAGGAAGPAPADGGPGAPAPALAPQWPPDPAAARAVRGERGPAGHPHAPTGPASAPHNHPHPAPAPAPHSQPAPAPEPSAYARPAPAPASYNHPAPAPEPTAYAHPVPAPDPTAYAHPTPAPEPTPAPYRRPSTPSPAGPAPRNRPHTPPVADPASAPPDATAPTPKQRKRRRGSARFAGMAEEVTAAPVPMPDAAMPELPVPPSPGGRTPRGARFAGSAEEPERTAVPELHADAEDRAAVVGAVRALLRLRGEGRSGEAHALLVEAAHWPAARFPVFAAELERAGLGADWATLLWEAASLPPERLVAAADALAAAGREADGHQILRQGVVRPAHEVAQAVVAMAAEGRRREVGALLDAYVRMRTPEEAARSAAVDPQVLVPLLLEAAQGVSDERYWDLLHALRVAGFAV
ncbi:hypothetical protein [Streptomyces sp. NPDC058739]|uniref:hypothetical protein n=1 Tax=Streptomyces sp. NPDC058739 TaxID=3346618 RepID=UPI0036D0E30B